MNEGAEVSIPAEIDGQKVLALGAKDVDTDNPTCITGAENIKTLNLENATNLEVIEDCAFYYCSNLEGTIESETVEKVGEYTFYNCTSLASVILSDAITTIPNDCFRSCPALATVTT